MMKQQLTEANNTFTITVDEVTLNGATISWTVPTSSAGQTLLYRVLLNGNEVINDLSVRTYTFTGLSDATDYNFTVYALDNNGNSTFSQGTFTTVTTTAGEHVVLSNQTDIDNFYFTSVWSLTLVGEGVNDVSNLSILQSAGDITISSTSLTSLNGLENIVNPNPPQFSNYPALNIRNNALLANIDALSNYTGGVRKLIIENNPVLNDVSNLQINDFMRELTLSDFPATNFSNFSSLEIIDDITLENISATSLAGFTSLSIVADKFELINIDFQNLNGLSNLNSLNALKITNSFNIYNINGIGDPQFSFNYTITGPIPSLNVDFLNDLEFSSVSILNTDLTNLNAFSNITNIKGLELAGNSNLTNISGLSNLTSIYRLIISNNENLMDLTGLNNLSTIDILSIREIPNLTNLNGLSSLTQIGILGISDCNQLISLEGTNLTASFNASETGVYINNNPLLSNFCAIQPYLEAGGIPYIDMGWSGGEFSYNVMGNSYNPTVSEIQTPEGCSQ